MVLSELGSTLSFSPLSLSHAGRYTCNTTVNEAVYTVFKDIALSKFRIPKYYANHLICIILCQPHLQILLLSQVIQLVPSGLLDLMSL